MNRIWIWTVVVAALASPACALAQTSTSVKQKPVFTQAKPAPSSPSPSRARPPAKAAPSQAPAIEHRVVIQVTQNDPGLMNMALNNAQNLTTHYRGKGESLKIEFVAYGPGLHMLRSDTSPVKDRLSTFALQNPTTVFSACGNTLNNQSKQESKELTLVSEARIVQTGIARVMELQEQGWAYVRP
jgi:intracellular sulfur oxidation DsrE/DsrF family protein